MNRVYIYSRVSTDHQTTDNQLAVLVAQYPNALVISEVASGAKKRPQLEQLLHMLQSGDTVVAYSLDRLGRSLKDIIQTVETIAEKQATLVLHREKASYDSAMGKLLIHIVGAVAELERELIVERIKAGLKARQGAGVRLGRPSTATKEQLLRVKELSAAGISCEAIGEELGVSRATVQRWRKQEVV